MQVTVTLITHQQSRMKINNYGECNNFGFIQPATAPMHKAITL